MHRAPSWHPFVPGGGTLAQCTQCASVPPSTVTIRLGLVHVYINKMYRSSVVWTKVTCSSGVSSAAMCVGVTSARGMCSSHVLVTCARCMCLLHVLVAYHRGVLISSSKSALHVCVSVSLPASQSEKFSVSSSPLFYTRSSAEGGVRELVGSCRCCMPLLLQLLRSLSLAHAGTHFVSLARFSCFALALSPAPRARPRS